MPAISVGSVEVDVLPNASGIRRRLQQQVVPAADEVGEELGRVIGRHVSAQIAQAVRDGITAGGRQAQAPATRQGQSTGGAFARSFRARVEAALADLPDVEIDADSTEAQREIARIRAQLLSMRDMQIGVDIDTAEATARVARLQERLQRLSASDADVQVRTDVAAASAQLAAFQALVNRIDGQDVNVRVDINTGVAQLALSNLAAAAVAFGPAILPVLPVVAAGLGAIAAAGVAAAAGVGAVALVAVPAFKQIGTVLQAQKTAQDAATQATYSGGQAATQAASKASELASAQAAVASAERSGAKQIAQAQSQVSQARRTAAQTAAQASQRAQQAARAVEDAEDSLADAQRDARKAQEDLTAARRTAAQELQDLNNQLTDSVLSQRDAEIQLQEATAERDAVLKNADSTELDKKKALLAYDQAVQRLKEQTTETGRLTKETASANKAGVEGSQTVKTAQEQLADAQDTVADKTTALRDAQADQARTATENAQQIADAQRRIADAQQGVADAQTQAAEQAAAAQRQLQQAQVSSTGSVDQAAIAQAKYEAELAKLSPAARETMQAYQDLTGAFSAWSKALQPAVMPIFTRALVSLRNTLPTLTPFVLGAARAIKMLQDRASTSVKKPFWQGFKKDLQTGMVPAIVGLGVAFGNVLKGMAGIIDAFLPHMDGISSRLQRVTGRFANWGANLKGSPAFEQFLQFAADKGPILAGTLGKIASAFFNVGQALSPLSGPLLQIVGWFANFIAVVADKAPWYIMLLYGIIVAIKLWTVAQAALNFVMSANPLVLIGLAILAVMAIVIYAYNRFGWFRAGVQAAWDGIKTGALFLWNVVLKPAFNGIVLGLQTLGRWAMWLWTTAIRPAFHYISLAARILLTAIVVAVILPLVIAFKAFGAIAMWLWTSAIQPAFEAIAAVAMWLWTNAFQPAFKSIGEKATWLWVSAIKPAWDAIQTAATFMWENILRPVFKAFWGGMKTIGGWAAWLYEEAIKPAFDAIVLAGKTAWEKGIKPVFDGWKLIIKGLGGLFDDAVLAIGTAWDKLKSVARKPVQFVVDTVYNKGIVGVWNKVAGAFGAPKLPKFKFAQGGVMPGYTPGRDVHKFLSPTGGQLELSGGEAIMRPEFTKAVGSGFVGAMNSIAKSRGSQGVKAALAPVFGGSAPMATDRSLKYAGGGITQSFADGGVFGWIGKAASAAVGAGSAAWNTIKKGASWLGDTLEASARAGVKNVVNPLLSSFPGMDTGLGKMIRKIPDKIIDALFGYSKKADDKGAGGIGGPRIAAALKWAKTQNGLPYQWGGNGNPSWDCSGLVSAAESVIRGQKPHRRWATGSFSGKTAPPGWVYHGNSAFKIGITNAGVGHTAGTLGKTNIESRGGDGVVIGKGARGYNDSLFGSWYGFKPGSYDSGGYLQPGLNLAYNGTGRPEPVFTSAQANALTSLAHQAATQQLGDLHVKVFVGNEQITDIARTEVRTAQGELIQVLNAS